MIFAKNNIRKRVLAVVEERITEGQTEFDNESKLADERLAEGVQALAAACDRTKAEAEKRIVSRITG